MTLKALILFLKPGRDMGDMVRVARTEGSRLFKGDHVKVLELIKRPKYVIAVVQRREAYPSERFNG